MHPYIQFLEVLDIQAKHGANESDNSKSKLEVTSKRHRKIKEFIDEHFSAELSTWDLEGEPNVHLLGKIQSIQASAVGSQPVWIVCSGHDHGILLAVNVLLT